MKKFLKKLSPLLCFIILFNTFGVFAWSIGKINNILKSTQPIPEGFQGEPPVQDLRQPIQDSSITYNIPTYGLIGPVGQDGDENDKDTNDNSYGFDIDNDGAMDYKKPITRINVRVPLKTYVEYVNQGTPERPDIVVYGAEVNIVNQENNKIECSIKSVGNGPLHTANSTILVDRPQSATGSENMYLAIKSNQSHENAFHTALTAEKPLTRELTEFPLGTLGGISTSTEQSQIYPIGRFTFTGTASKEFLAKYGTETAEQNSQNGVIELSLTYKFSRVEEVPVVQDENEQDTTNSEETQTESTTDTTNSEETQTESTTDTTNSQETQTENTTQTTNSEETQTEENLQ